MTLITNSHYISVSASGTDWRDTAKSIVEQIQGALTPGKKFTLGLIYTTDHLAQDLGSITNLFKSVLDIQHWSGSIGIGVFDNTQIYIREPAISVLLLDIPEDQFCLFRYEGEHKPVPDRLQEWLSSHDPMVVLTHAGSLSGGLSLRLNELENLTQGFLIGGVASSFPKNIDFAGERPEAEVSGVCFDQDVPISSSLSQGCFPIGGMHTITECHDEHIVEKLDYKPCYDVFQDDLRVMAVERLGKDPNDIIITSETDEEHVWDEVPEDFKDIFHGEVHVAFPVVGSDQNDYVVRNIMNMDYDQGQMAIAHPLYHGDELMFVHRNKETMRSDLTRMLVDLRKRVEAEQGGFYPKGAVYISCMARAGYDFSDDDSDMLGDEMGLIREIIGEVPLVGYYAGGEILNSRLYSYTGVLTLFL